MIRKSKNHCNLTESCRLMRGAREQILNTSLSFTPNDDISLSRLLTVSRTRYRARV